MEKELHGVAKEDNEEKGTNKSSFYFVFYSNYVDK